MITLRNFQNNYYALFRGKPLPRVRHRVMNKEDGLAVLHGTATGSKGEQYSLEIGLQPDSDGKVYYTSPMAYVHCSCPAFQFFVQDPLAKAGVSEPTGYRNKKINNPLQIAAPCKHLYAYVQYIMNRGLLVKYNMKA